MAFKIGPKSKRIQELEAALGVDATPVKPSVPLNFHLQKQEVNRSPVLRPSNSPLFVNKIDERRDQPQIATSCWHRQPKTYKVIYFSPSTSTSPTGSHVSSPPPPPARSISPPPTFEPEELPDLELPAPHTEEIPPSKHVDFAEPQEEVPVRFVASPPAREPSPERRPSLPSEPIIFPSEPVISPPPEPSKRAPSSPLAEGETPKERALNALKKAHINEPSRIPSLSVNSNFASKKLLAVLDSPTNKESKLRIPSRTSALRAAFEREAAAINEPAKPPVVAKKQPFVFPQQAKPTEAPKQAEAPPSGLTDVTKSWVEGEGFATGWHTKPNKFVVHARDAAGQVVTGSKCTVEMKSRVVHAAPIQVVVRKNTDGSHMCAYVPWHEGDYTMTINLDGRTLAEKQVRVRPASERHAAEIEDAARKQEEANKRRAGEQRTKLEPPPPPVKRNEPEPIPRELSHVEIEEPVGNQEHFLPLDDESRQQEEARQKEEEESRARETERLAEEQRLEEEKRAEEQRERDRIEQGQRELAEAEQIAREKAAYEEAARQVAEEEERQQAEQELRLLEQEEELLQAEVRQQAEKEEARLLGEQEETERQLQEEFEIAKHQSDLEEAEEARRTATRLREEAEEAQRQIEAEFEEARRLADLEEMEELRIQSELELARQNEEAQGELGQHEGAPGEHELEGHVEGAVEVTQAHEEQDREGEAPIDYPRDETPQMEERAHEEEPGADWLLPSPPKSEHSDYNNDPLHGLDPEEAVRQAAARGRSQLASGAPKVPDITVVMEESSEIAQALSEAAYRAQQEHIQAEVQRMKQEEEDERAKREEEAHIEQEKEELRRREQAEMRQRKQAEIDDSVVNFHAPITHSRVGKEELRKQPPTKRPPPPQKRPPAPPTHSSPKPGTELKNEGGAIICACGESNPINMKFCSGCGKRLAGGATHTSMHSFVEGQRAAAEKARLEADPEAAEREAREAAAEKARQEERERLRIEKEESDQRQWEETQRALDDAENGPPPLPPFEESSSVQFHLPPPDTAELPRSPRVERGSSGVVDASQSWMEGDGAQLGWQSRSNKFMVHARDSQGNPVLETKCVAEMKPISSRVPDITVIVHKNAEGTHTCAYLPFNEGEFLLSVSLNGVPIRDTPRKVIVKRR